MPSTAPPSSRSRPSPFALRALIGPGADELLLWGQRVLPARLLAAGFEFEHKDVDEALRTVVRS